MTDYPPLYSIHAGNPDMQRSLEAFVLRLRKMTDELDAACRQQDIEQLRSLCDEIKVGGERHGFAPLANIAGQAATQFHAEQSNVASLIAGVQEIIGVARRVKAG